MQYDFNRLRMLNSTLYTQIMRKIFGPGILSVRGYVQKVNMTTLHTINLLSQKYLRIMNELAGVRNSSGVRNGTLVSLNEFRMIVNHLDNNNYHFVDHLQQKDYIRAYLLYYIYYWEFAHINVGSENVGHLDAGRMSYHLLNASFDEIFQRFMAIKRQVNFYAVLWFSILKMCF